MAKAKATIGLTYNDLFNCVFQALKQLGASGTVSEIDDKVIEIKGLDDTVTSVLHSGNGSKTELEYQLAWA